MRNPSVERDRATRRMRFQPLSEEQRAHYTAALERVAELLEPRVRHTADMNLRESFFHPATAPSQKVALSLQATLPPYDRHGLETTVLGMIADYLSFRLDPSHRTLMLKNTRTNILTLDGVRRRLPQYGRLRTVSINDTGVGFPFKTVFDKSALEELVRESEFHLFGGEKFMLVDPDALDDPIVRCRARTLSFPYLQYLTGDASKDDFERRLHVVTDFVTAIHEKKALAPMSHLELRYYAPMLRLAFPESYEAETIRDLLTGIADEARGDVTSSEQFRPTEPTRRGRGNTYHVARSFVPRHVKYVLVDVEKGDIIVRFGSQLDMPALESALEDQDPAFVGEERLFVGEEKRGAKRSKSTIIQKGGGERERKISAYTRARALLDERGVARATVEGTKKDGYHTVRFPYDDDHAVRTAARLVGSLYENLYLVTPSPFSAPQDSNVCREEAEVIYAVENVADVYNLFVLPADHEREGARLVRRIQRGARGTADTPEFLDPLAWVTRRFLASPEPDFTGKMYDVIRQLDEEIRRERVAADTSGDESVQRRYAQFQELKTNFGLLYQATRPEPAT